MLHGTSPLPPAGSWGWRRACVLLIALALLTAGTARADAITYEAAALLEAGDSQGAYALLSPLEVDRAGDPRFDYLLGLAALETGRATEAVFAFERVLAVEPGNLLARADMARALAALNEMESARRELETVVREGDAIPPEARATIESYLQALRDQPFGRGGREVRAFIAAGYGYDSNVAASVATQNIGGPVNTLFIPEQSSGFGRLAGGFNVRYPVGPSWAIVAAGNSFAKLNTNDPSTIGGESIDFSQVAFNGLLGVEHLRGPDAYSAFVQADHFRIAGRIDDLGEIDNGGHAFRNAFGGTVQMRRRLSSASHITAYGQFSRLDYHNQSFRDVNRWSGGLSYARVFPWRYSPSGYLGLYGGTERNLTSSAKDQGHHFFGVRLGGSALLRRDLVASLAFNYEYRSYRDFDRSFALLTLIATGTAQRIRRRDDRVSVRASLDWAVRPRWIVTPSYEYFLASSTLQTTDFDRHVGMVTVRREFR